MTLPASYPPQLLAIFLRDAINYQRGASKRPMVVAGPPDASGCCYVVALHAKHEKAKLQVGCARFVWGRGIFGRFPNSCLQVRKNVQCILLLSVCRSAREAEGFWSGMSLLKGYGRFISFLIHSMHQ